jgi:cyclophilin family peptidyl-prolyl cis-trans isomerase
LIEIYPEAAPNAAQRFLELVNNGFYNNTPVSRVVEGFVAQFGVNWREGFSDWQNRNFDDDPSLFSGSARPTGNPASSPEFCAAPTPSRRAAMHPQVRWR